MSDNYGIVIVGFSIIHNNKGLTHNEKCVSALF